MMTGNCYLAVVYEKDLIISVNNPFTLYGNGNVRFICTTAQRQGYEPQYIKALGVQLGLRKPRFSVTFWMFVVCQNYGSKVYNRENETCISHIFHTYQKQRLITFQMVIKRYFIIT